MNTKIIGSSENKRIIKNIGWLFFDRIIRIAGGLFIGIWVARYLGPEFFGVLNYVIAYTALFSFLAKLGLDKIIIREIIRRPDKKDLILGTGFVLKLVGSVILLTAVASTVLIFKPQNHDIFYFVLIIAAGYVFQSFDVIDFFFQSRVQSKFTVLSKNCAFIVINILRVVFILNKFSLIYFVWMVLLEIFISTGLLIFFYYNNRQTIWSWKFDLSIAKELIKDAWPLMAGALFVDIYLKIDQVMIGNMLDSAQLGIYSAAVNLSSSWYFVPVAIVQSLYPHFDRLKNIDNTKYYQGLLRLYSSMLWLGVIAGMVALIWGQEIISLLYGPEYEAAASALIINIWAGIFVAQAVARGIWIIAENLQRYRLLIQLIVALSNIAGNMYLIPIMGIKGAALSTLCSQCLCTWGISLFFKPLRASTISMIKGINPTYILRFSKEQT